MREFDNQEQQIVRELIRNPRLSDNQVGLRTGIPVKTVNRKRKLLEEAGILNYAAYADHGAGGTGQLPARQLFVVEFKEGLTRRQLMDSAQKYVTRQANKKHLLFSFVGERDGRLSMMLLLESGQHSDLLEIFNAEIVPQFNQIFGREAVHRTDVHTITHLNCFFHNYLPAINMKQGIIKEDWSKDNIFVD